MSYAFAGIQALDKLFCLAHAGYSAGILAVLNSNNCSVTRNGAESGHKR